MVSCVVVFMFSVAYSVQMYVAIAESMYRACCAGSGPERVQSGNETSAGSEESGAEGVFMFICALSVNCATLDHLLLSVIARLMTIVMIGKIYFWCSSRFGSWNNPVHFLF